MLCAWELLPSSFLPDLGRAIALAHLLNKEDCLMDIRDVRVSVGDLKRAEDQAFNEEMLIDDAFTEVWVWLLSLEEGTESEEEFMKLRL